MELTYFETYPYLGVKLTNGRLISNLAEDSIGYQEDLMILRIPCCLSKKRSSYLTYGLSVSGKVTIPRVIMIVSVFMVM